MSEFASGRGINCCSGFLLQGSGPGIGVPFNVQHVAHIGADNVEALLLAAKDDPKLLPSFLLPEGVTQEKDDSKKTVAKNNTKTGGVCVVCR